MPRNRTIKTEFFSDPKIGRLSPTERLLFIAIWINSDDIGVCRGDYILLRNSAFPYDNFSIEDVKKMILNIKKIGLISLGRMNGDDLILTKNFLKHQQINRPSKFRYIEGSDKHNILELFGSLSTHDILTTDSLTKVKEKVKEKEKVKGSSTKPTCDLILDLYKKHCPDLPQVRGLSDKRKSLIKKSLSQNSDEAYYVELFSKANKIPFLRGESDGGWKANIDFLMRVDRQTAILEGVYGGSDSSKLETLEKKIEEMYPENLTESDVSWIGKIFQSDEANQ